LKHFKFLQLDVLGVYLCKRDLCFDYRLSVIASLFVNSCYLVLSIADCGK